ncbi:helix-turn-helix transcriptional regulator [Nostoc sp. FACHB-973]|nr:helix-turn-helix transcriptional regulator [Nostoc sp. FACHB-973]
MKVISKLPALMKARNLSQRDVVDGTGLAPGTVGKYFRGHLDRFDSKSIVALCKYFDLVEIGQLLELSDD